MLTHEAFFFEFWLNRIWPPSDSWGRDVVLAAIKALKTSTLEFVTSKAKGNGVDSWATPSSGRCCDTCHHGCWLVGVVRVSLFPLKTKGWKLKMRKWWVSKRKPPFPGIHFLGFHVSVFWGVIGLFRVCLLAPGQRLSLFWVCPAMFVHQTPCVETFLKLWAGTAHWYGILTRVGIKISEISNNSSQYWLSSPQFAFKCEMKLQHLSFPCDRFCETWSLFGGV